MTIEALPALRHLADLADLSPVIIIDTREQDPLPIRRFKVRRFGLQSGDYSAAGLEDQIAIERKSISDLVGCCMGENRERFERELHRLRGFRFKRLLIVGSRVDIENGFYRSNIKPQSVLASLDSWEVRYDVPVTFAGTPEHGAAQVEAWVWRYSRHAVETANDLLRGINGAEAAP